MFSIHSLKGFLRQSFNERQELKKLYEQLPVTRCRRRAHCCSLLPEITLIEALSIIEWLHNLSYDMRMHISRKIVGYFFLNPVEIIKCPFLDGKECLIYQERFFGCRAYGLWSREYYENLAGRNRQAKTYIRMQWEKMGVSLPQEVVEFQVPYCPHVEIQDTISVNGEQLMHVFGQIEDLSEKFSQWHHLFHQMYFSDLSFFLASLFYGTSEAVRLKFTIVSDIVKKANRAGLNEMVKKIPDIIAELA